MGSSGGDGGGGGGTGTGLAPPTTAGQLYVSTAPGVVELLDSGAAAAGDVLTKGGADPSGLEWAAPTGGGGIAYQTHELGADIAVGAAGWTDVFSDDFAVGTYDVTFQAGFLGTAGLLQAVQIAAGTATVAFHGPSGNQATMDQTNVGTGTAVRTQMVVTAPGTVKMRAFLSGAGTIKQFFNEGSNVQITGYVATTGGGGGGAGGATPRRIEVNCVVGQAPVDSLAGSGAWTVQADAGQMLGFVLSQNGTGVQNDYIAYDLLLSAGTWDFEALTQTGPGVGMVHFEADDGDGVFTDYGNVDGYTAGGVFNQRLRIPGMVIVGTASLRRVQLKMATKNAASVGYGLNITAFSLQRTA